MLQQILQWVDTKLCLHLKPWQLRLWWQCLYLRKDPFHDSLLRDPYITNALRRRMQKAELALFVAKQAFEKAKRQDKAYSQSLFRRNKAALRRDERGRVEQTDIHFRQSVLGTPAE